MVFGGLGRHVHAVAEAQANLGLDVTVVSLRADPRVDGTSTGYRSLPEARERINGVDVIRVEPAAISGGLTPSNLLLFVASMQEAMFAVADELFCTNNINIIHGHDWLVGATVTSVAAQAGVPLVCTVHATEMGRHQGWLPTATSTRIHEDEIRLVSAANEVIVCSQHMRDEVVGNLSGDADHIRVIANGIHVEQWPSAPLTPPEDKPVLVYCGRLEYEKGVQYLIAALPALQRTYPGLSLVVAGKGDYRNALERITAEHGLSDVVTFTGWLPEAELQMLMKQASAAVVPSLYEPFGVVALEAAATGVPLVVANTGGLAEFVKEGVTGRIFEPADPASLAQAIDRSLSDPHASARMSRAAFASVVHDHNWARIAHATTEVYHDAAKR